MFFSNCNIRCTFCEMFENILMKLFSFDHSYIFEVFDLEYSSEMRSQQTNKKIHCACLNTKSLPCNIKTSLSIRIVYNGRPTPELAHLL